MARRTTSRRLTRRVTPRRASSAEAWSVGLVQAAADTVVTALRGVREVGTRLGSSAVSAVRGSIRVAEDIGSALGRLTKSATGGAVDAREVGRVAAEAVQGAAQAVQSVGADAARRLGFGRPATSRRPLHRSRSRSRSRRQRRESAA